MSFELDKKKTFAREFKFSAMLCLYKNNSAQEVREALDSAFLDQTCPPKDLVAVFDGPVPDDVASVIDDYESRVPVRRIIFETNRGHGPARAAAVSACETPWIAIIDSDDISRPERFETLISIIMKHPASAVVGGGLTEFHIENGQRILGPNVVYPQTPEDVRQYIRRRSPVGQATSMLRVEAIKKVGNYEDWFNNEDYNLWIRLVDAGFEIRNVPDSLVLVRVEPGFYARRGGLKYWWNEVTLQRYSLRIGLTTIPEFLSGACLRFVVQVLMPNRMRAGFYKKVLRRK